MKQTVTESMFIDSFCGGYKDNFSYEGKKALFEYLEECESGQGAYIELDPVALCCEYTEYHGLCEYLADYNGDDIETIDDISSLTTVIPIDDCSFIIQCY